MITANKVLLVDDTPEYLDTMELYLPKECLPLRAVSPDLAKSLALKETPEIAIIDIRLNEEDTENREGLKLLEWFHENLPETKVIMISAYREFEFEAASLAKGAICFLRKPLRPDEFHEKVKETLERIS